MRWLIRGVTAFALIAGTGSIAHAQQYPARPIHAIVTMQGGPLDAFARLVTERMAQRLNEVLVVESRPGAGGNIATSSVARSPADGYTVLFTNDTTFTVNPALYAKLNFDPEADFIPVSVLGTFGQMIVVNPGLHVNSVRELATLSRKKDLSFSSSGNGTPSHLAFAYLQSATGARARHIPYKTNPEAVAAVIAGDVDAAMVIASTVVPHVRAGKLQGLAYSGRKRSIIAPDVPTVSELGYPGFEVEFSWVLLVPAGTPAPIVDTLYREAARAVQLPELAERMKAFDLQPTGLAPVQSAQWLRNARAKWTRLIKEIKLSVD
jgi:tripartite-type tricarboxylate transporter receptor subunit TctC